ncbi:MAG: hypothetical protein ACRCSR_02375, partial [Bacteroidales bacterium]
YVDHMGREELIMFKDKTPQKRTGDMVFYYPRNDFEEAIGDSFARGLTRGKYFIHFDRMHFGRIRDLQVKVNDENNRLIPIDRIFIIYAGDKDSEVLYNLKNVVSEARENDILGLYIIYLPKRFEESKNVTIDYTISMLIDGQKYVFSAKEQFKKSQRELGPIDFFLNRY